MNTIETPQSKLVIAEFLLWARVLLDVKRLNLQLHG